MTCAVVLAGFVVLLLGRELFLEFGRNVHGFEEAESLLGMLRDSEAHTETEFSVVFEEAVGPSGAAAFLVLGPRSGRQVTAVNGGATRSVGDNHAVTQWRPFALDSSKAFWLALTLASDDSF